MRCTITAMTGSSPPVWWAAPYWVARSDHSEAQHLRRLAITSSAPRTLRYVSYWPAKLASGRSSAVEEERTATSAGLRPDSSW